MSAQFFRDPAVALGTANKEGIVSIDARFVHLYATSFSAIRAVPWTAGGETGSCDALVTHMSGQAVRVWR